MLDDIQITSIKYAPEVNEVGISYTSRHTEECAWLDISGLSNLEVISKIMHFINTSLV